MTLPHTLQELVDEAYAAMIRDPNHALPPLYRKDIYRLISAGQANGGRLARARLALLSARYVIPIWERARPTDVGPPGLLRMAEALLTGQDIAEAARSQADAVWEALTELDVHSDKLGIVETIASGLAAVEALREALGKDPYEGVNIDATKSDEELDPYHTDAAQFAADAYSGPSWISSSSPEKRREFWEWWLREAVPMAWHVTK
jgi:hypothetical protein